MKMKKVFAIFMAVVMVMSLSAMAAESETEPATENTASQTASAWPEKATLTLYDGENTYVIGMMEGELSLYQTMPEGEEDLAQYKWRMEISQSDMMDILMFISEYYMNNISIMQLFQ